MTREEWIERLKSSTDEEIKDSLAAGRYGGAHIDLAKRELERRRELKAEAARGEEMDIARSAKDAAWESAKAAKSANRIAWIAIGISVISALVVLLG